MSLLAHPAIQHALRVGMASVFGIAVVVFLWWGTRNDPPRTRRILRILAVVTGASCLMIVAYQATGAEVPVFFSISALIGCIALRLWRVPLD